MQDILVINVKKKSSLLKIFLKRKNAEGTVITVMFKISFKSLIYSALCVAMLQLLDLLNFLVKFG